MFKRLIQWREHGEYRHNDFTCYYPISFTHDILVAVGSAINMELEVAVYYYFGSNSKDACAPAVGSDNSASSDLPLQSIFLGY